MRKRKEHPGMLVVFLLPYTMSVAQEQRNINLAGKSLGDEKERERLVRCSLNCSARRVFEQYSKQNFKQSAPPALCAKIDDLTNAPFSEAPSANISFLSPMPFGVLCAPPATQHSCALRN